LNWPHSQEVELERQELQFKDGGLVCVLIPWLFTWRVTGLLNTIKRQNLW